VTRIVSRAEWGTRYPELYLRNAVLRAPLGEMVAHTEAGSTEPPRDEFAHMRAIERFHVEGQGWSGVGYPFVIEQPGTILEGRGWLRQGAHTETRNATAEAFCFAGHGDKKPATEAQWASARWLIGEGIRIGALVPNPKITGHRDYSLKGKSCPGNLIYPHIGRLRGITGPVDEEDDMFTDKDRELLQALHDDLAIAKGRNGHVLLRDIGAKVTDPNAVLYTTAAKVSTILDKVEQMAKIESDPRAIAEAIVSALPRQDVDAVVDAIAERLKS